MATDRQTIRIAIIQTAFLGDTILSTALLRALHEFHVIEMNQKLEVHWVGTSAAKGLLRGFAVESEGFELTVHVLQKRGILKGLTGFFKAIAQVRGHQIFDHLYCIHRSWRSLFLGRLITSRQRTAFSGSAMKNALLKALGYRLVSYLPYDEKNHYVDRVLNLAPDSFAVLGQPSLRRPLLPSAKIENPLFLGQRFILLSPFSVWGTKMWPALSWQTLVELIFSNPLNDSTLGGLAVGIVGNGDSPWGMDEERRLAEMILGTQAGPLRFNLVGKTSLPQLNALVRGAAAVVTNDSALVHFAAAWNTPTVTIYGPTAPKWGFAPLSAQNAIVQRNDLRCRPCHIHGPDQCPLIDPEKNFQCMLGIRPANVLQALIQVLRPTPHS